MRGGGVWRKGVIEIAFILRKWYTEKIADIEYIILEKIEVID